MAKSIIQARTGPADRECFLCREEAERNGYYGELCHTGLHKRRIAIARWMSTLKESRSRHLRKSMGMICGCRSLGEIIWRSEQCLSGIENF